MKEKELGMRAALESKNFKVVLEIMHRIVESGLYDDDARIAMRLGVPELYARELLMSEKKESGYEWIMSRVSDGTLDPEKTLATVLACLDHNLIDKIVWEEWVSQEDIEEEEEDEDEA